MMASLNYPIEPEPQTGDGSAIEIAPGVLWLRMPLFASLPWINVWAIAEEAGWTIVDTGLHSLKTIDAWQAAFAGPLGGAPVLRVVVTHMHPDHCGMAGWITERFKAPLCMSRLEYLTCRLMAADTGRKAPEEGIAFYRAAGWDAPALERYKDKFGSFGQMIYPLPASYHRISDGDALRFGAHEWTVAVGNGHSPEHACLHCPELKLFISGDQVLPRISSNVSNVSDTARWVAVYRAWESARPDALFNDPYAKSLAGERGQAIATLMPAQARSGWPMVARTKLIDDLVQAAVAQGCDCVINLAAGLDTRALSARAPQLTPWIEADLPALIEEKEQLLADAKPRCQLRRIKVDLTDTSRRVSRPYRKQ